MKSLPLLLAGCLAVAFGIRPLAAEPLGETRVASWKDDKTGVFLLMFDDSWPSHWQVAIPELQKRGLIATFYICPGKGEYKVCRERWEKDYASSGQVYANHTMTHKGVKDMDDARVEILEPTKIIRAVQPGKENRLVSYGQPGVGEGKWNISGAELDQLLKEDNQISRPPFKGHGAMYHQKTLEEMTALVDSAIATKGMDYLVVHGVERLNASYQDMWALKQEIFFPLLDYMKAKSDAGELWVTDHISQHQYETERAAATVQTVSAAPAGIRLKLASSADANLYDYPLTLVTRVPADWKTASVRQGNARTTVPVQAGLAKYDAVPNGADIELTKAN
jgi:hypothetical protein